MDIIAEKTNKTKQRSVKVREVVQNLIKQATGDRNAILAPRLFIDLFDGDHNAALVLNQVLYWSERCTHPDGWFYKTYADWEAELGMSKYQIKRVFNGDPRVHQPKRTLREVGVETIVRRAPNGSPTVHYRVDLPRFFATLRQFLGQHFGGCDTADMPNVETVAVDNVDFLKATESPVESQQCVLSSDTEITPENSAEIVTDHAHEDDDLKALHPYEQRFGKLKKHIREMLKPLVNALGWQSTNEVIARCVGRGRSWHYVARALSNEIADRQKTISPQVTAAVPAVLQTQPHLQPVYPDVEEEAVEVAAQPSAVVVDASVHSVWDSRHTVADAWNTAYHQLEFQMDRSNFSFYVKHLKFVHFDADTKRFTFVTETTYHRDTLMYRLDRHITKVLQIAYGDTAAHTEYLIPAEWVARRGSPVDDLAAALAFTG